MTAVLKKVPAGKTIEQLETSKLTRHSQSDIADYTLKKSVSAAAISCRFPVWIPDADKDDI